MIAYAAHYYGTSPLIIEGWKTSEIYEWYNEAAKIEHEKWKSVNSSANGQKS
jgi:hypothetical protein